MSSAKFIKHECQFMCQFASSLGFRNPGTMQLTGFDGIKI
jgi:hypothetical protein